MPTYEYACKSCGEHIEVVQSFQDEPLTTCPTCQGALRKVFGNIGITFKGSGFYKTDSRSGSSRSAASSGPSSSSSGESSGSGDGAPSDAGGSGSSDPAKPSAPAPTPSTSSDKGAKAS
jgi:putative FmdB family regulatory protein